MNKSTATCTAMAVGLTLGSAPAPAHHSQAMFDMSKCLTLTGTVRTFQYQFPHSWLWVVVQKGDGTEDIWGMESAGPAQMMEVNPKWSRTVVKKGDKISLTYSPMKDGRNAGALATLTLPDGTVLRAATPACNLQLGAPNAPLAK
jgi:Family of unknown function (DUF6152)